MSAQLLLTAGVSAAQTLFGGLSARRQAKRANEIAAQRARLANAVRLANNTITASQNYLHSFGESINNQNRGKAYDRNHAAITRDLIRDSQTSQGQDIMSQVRVAAARGELQARAAAAGIGGTSVDRMDGIMEIQSQIAKEATDRMVASKVFEGHEEMFNASMEMLLGMSLGYSGGILDFAKIMPDTVDVPSLGSIAGNALATGAATYFTAKK